MYNILSISSQLHSKRSKETFPILQKSFEISPLFLWYKICDKIELLKYCVCSIKEKKITGIIIHCNICIIDRSYVQALKYSVCIAKTSVFIQLH